MTAADSTTPDTPDTGDVWHEVDPEPAAQDPGVEAVEVVPHEETPHARETTAIEAAADAALAMPGVPGRDEFLALAMQARVLSMSAGAPAAVQNNPHLAFHVAMVGRDLGISPSAALELIDVIDGGTDRETGRKRYRLSLSPQLINGQVRRLGLGAVVPVRRSPWEAVAAALGPRGVYDPRCAARYPDHHEDCRCFDVLGTSEFTWEDARIAGLVGKDCEPGDHKATRKSSSGRAWCGCNQGYITYPARMLWWRAAGFCADDFFPEAGLGLYSPEALGAVVGPDGRPVDPADVDLPAGYEPAVPKAIHPAKEKPADPEVIAALQARVEALPEEFRTMLAEKWKNSRLLTWDDDHGNRHPIRLADLPDRAVNSAESLIKGMEVLAEKAAASQEATTPAETPQDSPEDEPGTNPPETTAEAADEPSCAECGAPATVLDHDRGAWCADHAPF